MSNKSKTFKKRICIGLSGGVDSAVTAALLKKEGHDIHGVFIKGWYPEGLPCTWAKDRQDAMRVAAHLSIPFSTLDASKEYKKSVIDYIIREYKEGRTPNPDIMCNRDVKFGAFFDFAMKQGADMIATGHYARIRDGTLLRGKDKTKDQSYFLWAIPSDILRRVLFPLGELEKVKVRELARVYRLPVAKKKDSQGICFLGFVSIEDFLLSELPQDTGRAVTQDGKEIGTHKGSVLYTIGERVPLISGSAGPWYLHSKDMFTNELVVSRSRYTPSPPSTNITLTDTRVLEHIDANVLLEAQYRYHGPKIKGYFEKEKEIFTASTGLTESLAQGQSLVMYTGEQCVGGGIIK